MSQLRSLRRVTLLVLLLVVAAGPGWAEYCKSQGSPRIPKSQIGPYDAAALLSTTQIIDSSAVEDSAELAGGFQGAMGWDPREMDGWMFYRLRPTRIQAFRGYDEIEGRDVMVRSRWLA